MSRSTAQAVARGIGGGRLVGISGDPAQAPALWFAVLASHGVTFGLVTREEFRRTRERMADAVRLPALGESLPETV